jgi:hypothetical protein
MGLEFLSSFLFESAALAAAKGSASKTQEQITARNIIDLLRSVKGSCEPQSTAHRERKKQDFHLLV